MIRVWNKKGQKARAEGFLSPPYLHSSYIFVLSSFSFSFGSFPHILRRLQTAAGTSFTRSSRTSNGAGAL